MLILLNFLFPVLSCAPPNPHNLFISRYLQDGPPVPEPDYQPLLISLIYVNPYPDPFSTEVFPRAIAFYSNILSIASSPSIKISSESCQDLQIPASSKNKTISAHVVIFMTYNQSSTTSSWAVPCEVNEEDRMRPIMGRIHFEGPFSNLTWEQKFSLSMHQIAHVLAYDSHLIPFFLNSLGERHGISQIIGYRTVRNSQISYIKTPSVLAYSREGFQCESIYGLDIANANNEFSSSIHWEKRIMNSDFMTAGYNKSYIIFSKISLALFEDSGWYQVDYSYGNEILWGYQKGCGFIYSKCLDNTQPNFPEFCNLSSFITQCDYSATYKGSCSLTELSSPIPAQYQYFSSPYQGGSDPELEYCPVVVPSSAGSCLGIGEEPTKLNTADYGESAGFSSKCLQGTYVNQLSKIQTHLHAGCHKITCEGDIAVVHVGKEVVFCTPVGGKVTIRGYNGYLICPSSDILCKDLPCPFACNGRGKCKNGKCLCLQGSYGRFCENFSVFFGLSSFVLILIN